ncbi:MAG: RhuM family protein, partial [Anaerovoracaceae bacterium]
MGLTNYKGAVVRKGDIEISKNYLQKDELEDLNRIVTMFLDHAEDMARGKTPMTMADWDGTLNEFLQFRRREVLQGAGQVSHDQMERKVLREYAAYHARQLKLPEAEEPAELPEIAGE